jgi:hypothetical protein
LRSSNPGIAIIPASVGYDIVAIDPVVLHRIFVTMKRQHKEQHAMIGSYTLHKGTHGPPPVEAGMVRLSTVDLDFPVRGLLHRIIIAIL